MAKFRDRPACMSDLTRYFKKTELLGGLTASEQRELRKNIGIHWEFKDNEDNEDDIKIEDIFGKAEVTYDTLLEKINSSSIVVGKLYTITNYRTVYQSNVKNSEGVYETWGRKGSSNVSEEYHLVVQGIDYNRISSEAYIIGKDWKVNYDITKETLPDGWSTMGKITYLEDTNGNSAYYDFKNIKFRRTSEQLGDRSDKDLDLYTFSTELNGEVIEGSQISSNFRNNKLSYGCYDNVFIGDTYNNEFKENCRRNTFVKGCNDSTFLWDTVDNTFYEPVTYTTGSIQGKVFPIQKTLFSTSSTKHIHRIEYEGKTEYIVTFLDPITYSQQVIPIKRKV